MIYFHCNECFFSGLSEKLHSIPKEAIQVLPKEVTLPTNGLIPDIPLEQVNRWKDGGGTQNESIEETHNEQIVVEPIAEEEANDKPVENESDEEIVTDDILVTPPEVNDFTQASSNQLQDNNELELSDSFEIDDDNLENNVNVKKEIEENDVNSSKLSRNSSPKVDCEETFVDRTTKEYYEDNDDDDDFGDFDSANVVHVEEQEKEEGDDDDEFGNFEEMQPTVPPLTLDEDVVEEEKNKNNSAVEDCDEFGDFASNQEGNTSLSFASAAGWASLDSSPRGKLDQILIGVSK